MNTTPFIRLEEQFGGQVWAGAPQPHQPCDTPGHHQVQRDGALQALNLTQLQCLDPAAVLDDVKQQLDLPACPVLSMPIQN